MNFDKFEKNLVKKSKIKEIPIFETEFLDIPKSSIIELRGLHNSGIMNFSLNLLNEIQSKGNIGLFVDTYHSLDINSLNKETLLMQPNSPKEIIDIITQKPLLKCLKIAVIDSVLNLLPLNYDYTQFDLNMKLLKEITEANEISIIILNPYLSNKYNILSKYADIIIKLIKVKYTNNKIQGKGIVVKNVINLNCKNFTYTINH